MLLYESELDKIKCPYCGHIHEWEKHALFEYESKEFEFECYECQKKFDVEQDNHVEFICNGKEDDND